MADLSITATAVIMGTSTVPVKGIAGATITIGQSVYLDSATNTLKLADANASSSTKVCVGIALTGAASGQTMWYMPTGGSFTMNAALTAGTFYYLSNTAGGICPIADVSGAGTYVVQLGYATSTTVFVIQITDTGVSL